MTIPQRERVRTNHDRTAPLRTPTHIGCAFSIDREFFYEIGAFDHQMDIWGSENLESALRVRNSNKTSYITNVIRMTEKNQKIYFFHFSLFLLH